MYATDHVFPTLPICGLVKEVNPATPYELFHDSKPSVGHLRELFCPVIAKKFVAQKDGKQVNMRNQPQHGYCGIFVGFPKD